MDDKMIKIVIDRANEMLKDGKINNIYQSFKTKDDAENWLLKSAIATLIIPNENR
jgi:hypothetical protein